MTRERALESSSSRRRTRPVAVRRRSVRRRGRRPAITHDSRQVERGRLFACLRGDRSTATTSPRRRSTPARRRCSSTTSSTTVGQARRSSSTTRGVPRAARGAVSAIRASADTVGITGTNGKTTTRQMLAAIFEATGGDRRRSARCTGRARRRRRPTCSGAGGFVADGDAAVLEVSSHALALHRVDGTRSTSSCSPTSVATTSTCTARRRSTSEPRRRCSRATSPASA